MAKRTPIRIASSGLSDRSSPRNFIFVVLISAWYISLPWERYFGLKGWSWSFHGVKDGTRVDLAGDVADRAAGPAVADRDAAQHVVEQDEDRELGDHGDATAERVEVVFLVERHQLGVELLAVSLVLRLQLLQLRLQSLHLDHRPRALERQRGDHDHHRDGEQRDGDAVVGDQGVEPGQDPGDELEEPIEHGVRPSDLGCADLGRGRSRSRPMDGSEPAGARSASSLATHRAVRAPRRRRSNRMG